MSFPTYSLLIMLLFLSHDACSARPLGLFIHQTAGNHVRFLSEDAHDHADVNKVSTSITELCATKDFSQEKQDIMQGHRTEFMFSSGRSLLVSTTDDDARKAVDSKENDAAEDAVVMDYARPHRKPPIHNEKA